MIRAAVIADGKIVDILQVVSLEHYAGCVEVPEVACIGWLWDGANASPPPMSLAELAALADELIETALEAKAHELGYRNQERLAGYATSADAKFGPEARAFIAWRDACWRYGIEAQAAIVAGGPVPSADEFLAGLPVFSLGA